MKGKRKQYKMMQVKFGQVADINGKLTVTEEPRLIPNSENLFFRFGIPASGQDL